MTGERITAEGVSKAFGGVYAVRDVSMSVAAGTVHALVGQNGAGKSTMLGMLGGRLRADEGAIRLDGERMSAATPQSRRQHGIFTVYQELTIVPEMSALENVFLGSPVSRFGLTSFSLMRERFAALCAQFEVDIPADAPGGTLSVAQQQVVEIMRGVGSDARVLLLDEPTAALAEHERESLYGIIGRLVESGVTIVFVSHNLDEVLRLSDTVTVMRDGRHVETRPAREWDRRSLIAAMVGRQVSVVDRRELPQPGAEAVRLEGWRRSADSEPMDLAVRSGEIVGLWGLVGSGRSSFLNSLAGVGVGATGGLRIGEGADARELPRSPREAARRGIGLVHESRKRALVMGMDGVENFWLGRRSRAAAGLIAKARELGEAEPVLRGFGFDPARAHEPVGRLSGGNQQKALLAKWAGRGPRLLLIDEPTRGVDVAAKSEALDSIVRMARGGTAIVLTSSELEEVLAVAHRLIVKLGFSQKEGASL
jgi:ribose transport system ATP-binding protein/rhamnose transport system ATP-binding protein